MDAAFKELEDVVHYLDQQRIFGSSERRVIVDKEGIHIWVTNGHEWRSKTLIWPVLYNMDNSEGGALRRHLYFTVDALVLEINALTREGLKHDD